MTNWKLIGSYTISNTVGYNVFRDEETDEWGIQPWQDNAWIKVVKLANDRREPVLIDENEAEIPFGEVMRVEENSMEYPHTTKIKPHIMVRCLSLDEAKQLFHEVGSINANLYEIEELWNKYGNKLCFGTWPGQDYGKKIILAFACSVDDQYLEEHHVPVYLYSCVDIPYGDWNIPV